jgi:hypothetical protein
MPYYRVFFHWVTRDGRVKHDHVHHIDATTKEDAKMKVIRGEKPRRIAVDRVVKL